MISAKLIDTQNTMQYKAMLILSAKAFLSRVSVEHRLSGDPSRPSVALNDGMMALYYTRSSVVAHQYRELVPFRGSATPHPSNPQSLSLSSCPDPPRVPPVPHTRRCLARWCWVTTSQPPRCSRRGCRTSGPQWFSLNACSSDCVC
jgi:hypothetical protein